MRARKRPETPCVCKGCGGVAWVLLGPGGAIDGTEICDACAEHYRAVVRYEREQKTSSAQVAGRLMKVFESIEALRAGRGGPLSQPKG